MKNAFKVNIRLRIKKRHIDFINFPKFIHTYLDVDFDWF